MISPDLETFLLEKIRQLHCRIRGKVLEYLQQRSYEQLSQVAVDTPSDVIFSLDKLIEPGIIQFLEEEVAPEVPFVLVAEGVSEEEKVFPVGRSPEEAPLRIIIDPIDGTRVIMYDKRPAWILTGVAPNRGPETTLKDIEIAVQTEIPITRQYLSDTLWAVRGRGAFAVRTNLLTGEKRFVQLKPTGVDHLEQGFVNFTRFFPGPKDLISEVEERMVRRIFGGIEYGKGWYFEDQYLSAGGQLYELICGRDRLTADLRALMDQALKRRGEPLGLCCHPYDLCTELIARESGVIVTDERGQPLNAPLDTTTNVSWIAYANESIRKLVEPVLQEILRDMQLI